VGKPASHIGLQRQGLEECQRFSTGPWQRCEGVLLRPHSPRASPPSACCYRDGEGVNGSARSGEGLSSSTDALATGQSTCTTYALGKDWRYLPIRDEDGAGCACEDCGLVDRALGGNLEICALLRLVGQPTTDPPNNSAHRPRWSSPPVPTSQRRRSASPSPSSRPPRSRRSASSWLRVSPARPGWRSDLRPAPPPRSENRTA
jgi:hypothetical protein